MALPGGGQRACPLSEWSAPWIDEMAVVARLFGGSDLPAQIFHIGYPFQYKYKFEGEARWTCV
jgi:hypothetical protein